MNDEYIKFTIRIGNKIRRLIKEEYKSIEKFSDKFGIDVRTASRWLNNGIDSWYKLQELCDFFKLDFNELIMEGIKDETL